MPNQPDYGERQTTRRAGTPSKVKRPRQPWVRPCFLAVELLFLGLGVLYVYFGQARLEETCGAWFRPLQAGLAGVLLLAIVEFWDDERRLAVIGLVVLVLGGLLATTQFPPFYSKPEPSPRRAVDSLQPGFRK